MLEIINPFETSFASISVKYPIFFWIYFLGPGKLPYDMLINHSNISICNYAKIR
jgi:hypothetical protein